MAAAFYLIAIFFERKTRTRTQHIAVISSLLIFVTIFSALFFEFDNSLNFVIVNILIDVLYVVAGILTLLFVLCSIGIFFWKRSLKLPWRTHLPAVISAAVYWIVGAVMAWYMSGDRFFYTIGRHPSELTYDFFQNVVFWWYPAPFMVGFLLLTRELLLGSWRLVGKAKDRRFF
jgi:hypothetical protein